MADGLRQAYADALLALDDRDPDAWIPVLDAVLAVRDEELAEALARLYDARRQVTVQNSRVVQANHRADAAERRLDAVREECHKITRWAHFALITDDMFAQRCVFGAIATIRAALW